MLENIDHGFERQGGISMKTLLSLWLLCMMATPTLAQVQTLISGDIEHGGFGGPVLHVTELNGEIGLMVGGRGGWIINHQFAVGIGGYGLVTHIEPKDFRTDTYLEMGYGGVVLEYIEGPHKLIHFSTHILVGAGGVDYRYRYFDRDFADPDAFFIAEPGVNVILNVTEVLRIGLGGSYRHIRGVDLTGTSDSDLSGPSATLTLKLGVF
jgi:hypothetical protein